MARKTIKKERDYLAIWSDWLNGRDRPLRLLSYPIILGFIATCSSPPNLLDQVIERGELHVVTLDSATTFYQDGDDMVGPEYDLVAGLAESLDVKLVIKTVNKFADIQPALESGQVHLAAAGLTPSVSSQEKMNFGYPYANVDTHLIYKRGTVKPQSMEDLIGRVIEVTTESDHQETLSILKQDHPNLIWSINTQVDVHELLNKVNREEVDFTIADSNEFALQRHTQPELRIAMNLKKNNPLAWAYRQDNSRRLMEHADNYLIEAEREGLIAQINERYYGHAESLDYVDTRTFIEHITSRLPDFREMFEEAGIKQDVDWRLLAAIGYQESHWQPRAISHTGVRGIMMLTRVTAKELNIDNRLDPLNSIQGGAEYFAKQWERLPEDIQEPDRSWFALAAYNVGFGHLKDAWQITQWQGNDPTQWANVSKSLPLLANKLWYPYLSHGYARGWEPVIYVNNIRSYYDILINKVDIESKSKMAFNKPINLSDAP
jgi:membrane-bound lytic murein transglycosylase F